MALWLFHATPEEREERERLSAEIRAMPRPEPPPREPDLLKRYRAALERIAKECYADGADQAQYIAEEALKP